MTDAVETTIFDVLRKIVDAVVGGDLHRELSALVNKIDPDYVAPEPEPTPTETAEQAEIADLKAKLAAAEAAAPPVAESAAAPAF